jgi:transcriptional regulator with XRE-family HTH domain
MTTAVEKAANIAIDLKAIYDSSEAINAVFSQIGTKLGDQADVANKLRVGFQQSFGIFEAERGRDIVKRVSDIGAALTEQGISTTKLAEAYKLVGTSINSFVLGRTVEATDSFAKLVAINQKFGVDTGDTIKVINRLSTGFGMNTENIEKFSNKLLQFSRETGQEFKKVFQEFNQNAESFFTILSPEKAATQFMSFQQMARGFGTSIDKLMDTAAKFDSIEEGVQFGTKLNNILSTVGGSFDSVLATTMNYDDRIKYLIQSIGSSRGQIDQMSEVSQRAFLRELQMASGLDKQTIQAVLRNENLINSMDKLTQPERFEKTAQAPVEKMADNFTTFQDRANLFMNEYLKVGSRLEAVADQTSINARNLQLKILRAATAPLADSKTVGEFLGKIKTSLSQVTVNKLYEGVKKEIETQAAGLKKSIMEGMATPKLSSLTYTPVSVKESPTAGGKTAVVASEDFNVRMAESVKQGVLEANKTKTTTQVVVTLEGTPELLAAIKVKNQQTKSIPGSTVLATGRKE